MIIDEINKQICAIDLFCGAGGLTRGLRNVGINVQLGIDIDPACEYPYSENNEATFMLKSVEDITADDLMDYFDDNSIKLLAGCAPCQTFSSYNQKATDDDDRWWLLSHFSRLVDEVKPEIVTMENVPGLVGQNVFDGFIEKLETNNYKIFTKVVNCAEYGIPQHRNRLVLLASKLGDIRLLSPEELDCETKTVRDAISTLAKIHAGSIDADDPIHRCSELSEINMRRIKASKPGGSWRDWPSELIVDCHKKETGKTYPSVYGRMNWDEPAPTITTQFYGYGNGRFGHPEQDRALSLREGAILQSFPPDYKFASQDGEIQKRAIGRLIGNAVPVRLGEVIGHSIIAHTSIPK